MNGLFAAAAEVQRLCEQERWGFCFIGGVAVLRWGEPRLTRDVDVALGALPFEARTVQRSSLWRVPRYNPVYGFGLVYLRAAQGSRPLDRNGMSRTAGKVGAVRSLEGPGDGRGP